MTDIYRVVVYRKEPGTDAIWTKTFEESTSAVSDLNAMDSILATAKAREMRANQRAIDEEPVIPDPGGNWETHPFHTPRPRKR